MQAVPALADRDGTFLVNWQHRAAVLAGQHMGLLKG